VAEKKPKITKKELDELQALVAIAEDEDKVKLQKLLQVYKGKVVEKSGKETFLDFIQHVYPGYMIGAHHQKLANIFEAIAKGEKKRVIVNIAPRHGKSELISYLAPAWFLGKFPHKKIIMASHTADLAVNFGRRVRNLVGSDAYKDVFPQVELQADSEVGITMGDKF
jgi:hypothetical protein